MKRNAKKILSLFLALCFTLGCFALLPSSAFGAKADFTPGDVDGDGMLTPGDARFALRRAVGLETYAKGTAKFLACDVDGDGDVTPGDARRILRAAVGLEKLIQFENEYDILRSGSFYLDATMESGGEISPMQMAADPNGDLYALVETEGIEMGFLIKSKKLFLLNPAAKKYTEINRILLSMFQLDPKEFSNLADEMGFQDMKPLSEAASVTDGEYDGVPCKIYRMNEDYGYYTLIYLAGEKFLAMETVGPDGKLIEALRIHSISAGFPKMPPAGYKECDLLEFMIELGFEA